MLKTNQMLKETIKNNKGKLQVGNFVDSYNRTIRSDGLSCAILIGISFRNEHYVIVKGKQNGMVERKDEKVYH